MKKLLLALASIFLAASSVNAQSISRGVTTWTADQNFVNDIQAQINALQPLAPCPSGSFITGQTSGVNGCSTISGDVSASISTPGKLTVNTVNGGSTPLSLPFNGAGGGANSNLTGANVNGEPNIQAYGLNTDTLTSSSCTANGSVNLTSCGANTLVNGQHVAVLNAGPANALGAPSGELTVNSLTGSNGHTGSTVDGYCVTTVDANMGESACSTITYTSSAAATLGANQFNNFTWNQVANAAYYKVYFCTGAACSTMKLIGWVYGNAQAATGCPGSGSCLGYTDYGFPASAGPNPPMSATRDSVFTTIVSGGGTTTMAIGTATTVGSGSVTVVPDDTAVFNSAVAALVVNTPNATTPAGGKLKWPRGHYSIPRPIVVPSQVYIDGDFGSTEFDANSAAAPNLGYGTTLVYSGQTDGLPTVVIWDGVAQALHGLTIDDRCYGGLNTSLSDTACGAGSALTLGMTGWYADSDATTPGGTDQTTIDHVTVAGAHHAAQIGGTLGGVAYNGPPAADVSGTDINTPWTITYNATDKNNAEGLIFETPNAGFASKMFDPGCVGELATCVDLMNVGQFAEIVAPNCALSSVVSAQRVCIKNSSGSGGFITGTIDDSTHNSGSYSYWQPATALGAATLLGMTLAGNEFENGVQLDGGSNVISLGNSAGGQTPTWQVNNASISVYSWGDANGGSPQCAWQYESEGVGYITGCSLNPGGEALGMGYISMQDFSFGIALDPADTADPRMFILSNFLNAGEAAFVGESAANSGIPAATKYTLLDIVPVTGNKGYVIAGQPTENLQDFEIYGPVELYGSSSGHAVLQAPAAAGTPTITLPITSGTAGQGVATDGGAGTGWTYFNVPNATMMGTGLTLPTTATTDYFFPIGTSTATGTEANAEIPAGKAITYTQLNCGQSAAEGTAGHTTTFTLVDTTSACSSAPTSVCTNAVTCVDTAGTCVVAKGDVLTISVTSNNTANARNGTCYIAP